MKKKIRRGVFETNSSSTHSICITRSDVLDDQTDEIYFELGEFGWEYDILSTVFEKASYLYTALIYNDEEILLEKVKKILDKNGVRYEFEDPESRYYYVDHGNMLSEFLHDVCNDENKLMRYLFSSESFIITANDNDYYDISIDVEYAYDEYYKGN